MKTSIDPYDFDTFYHRDFSKEDKRILNRTNKLYRKYVNEKIYNSIKGEGEYEERMFKGCSVLIDHANTKLSQFILIKIPEFIKQHNGLALKRRAD